MNQFTKSQEPATAIDELLENLYNQVSAMEELQADLAEAIDCYKDESSDEIAQMQLYLDDAIKEQEINEMLYMELNAGRKELLRLIGYFQEKGIMPPDGSYIHYGRLDPECYGQDPASPFYTENPDERYRELLQGQYLSLREFEEQTPMTMPERNALRDHVIRETRLNDESQEEWTAFLKGFRARSKR